MSKTSTDIHETKLDATMPTTFYVCPTVGIVKREVTDSAGTVDSWELINWNVIR